MLGSCHGVWGVYFIGGYWEKILCWQWTRWVYLLVIYSWSNTEILDFIKASVIKGGATSVFKFVRQAFQSSKSDKIGKEELEFTLSKLGIPLTVKNIEKIFKLFGAESDGISTQEFVQTIIGEMEPVRVEAVQKAFSKLSGNSGEIIIAYMTSNFNMADDPSVLDKKKTEKQVLAQFLDTAEMFFVVIVWFKGIYRKRKIMSTK